MGLKLKMISGSLIQFSNQYLLKYPRSRLLWEISKLPHKPTVKQQLKVTQMQSSLRKQVKDFFQTVTIFLPTHEEVDLCHLKKN